MWAGCGGRDRAILNRAADRFAEGCALAWRPFCTHAELPMDTPRHATVIGAGIVGICCAIELRRRGLQVTVVDRLETDGLVRRTPSETDRRTVFVALTPEGFAQFEGLAAEHEAEVARMFGGLSEADLDAMTDILKRVGT